MDQLLRFFLQSFIRRGSLDVTLADGTHFSCGDGTGKAICVRFATEAAQRHMLLDPELALGECVTDETLVIENAGIVELLALVMDQPTFAPAWSKPLQKLRFLARHIQQLNSRRRARNNVSHHYDLDGRLYSLFLDSDRQYSCAYFERPDQNLDDAQLAKKRHLAAKLLVEPGQRVLDIGSGWGGLGLYLCEIAGGRVTGVTLSEEQLRVARQRADEKRLSGRIEFRLQDYRDIKGPFDRIISVGMFEHVGIDYYDRFFRRCAEMLTDEGVMMLHAIGRSEGPGATGPWIEKYIFPGGYIPALSEVLPAIERAGLLVGDIEILRLHYAETLKAWRERFRAHAEQAEQLYDKRFVRMWEFYLAASEMSFRKHAMMNFQIQLTKRQGIVPMTRDYIAGEEARLRRIESGKSPRLQLAGE
jgi:cyclopropane-fatty-acyl-phospholipid synthase